MGMNASTLLQPRIEGEIAFVLGHDLTGPGITPADVVRATEGVTAALEIIDSRIRDWKIKIQDTVADNASSAAFVLGAKMVAAKILYELGERGMIKHVIEAIDGPMDTPLGLEEHAARDKYAINVSRAYDKAVAEARSVLKKTKISELI